MTETKIAESEYSKLILSNPYYKIYTANCNSTTAIKQESSMGTAIAVLNPLQPYIHNILTLPGTALAVDFYFPNNKRIRIISVYLPSNNKKLNTTTQNKVAIWI